LEKNAMGFYSASVYLRRQEEFFQVWLKDKTLTIINKNVNNFHD